MPIGGAAASAQAQTAVPQHKHDDKRARDVLSFMPPRLQIGVTPPTSDS
jgi:hypothetical protein